jgi:hypothetical protein
LPLADVLVHCGDFSQGDYRGDDALDHWLTTQPHALKIVLRGNHDGPTRGGCAQLPKSKAWLVGAHPILFRVGGMTLLALPWHQARDGGGRRSKHWQPPLPLPPAHVVLSHAPPRGVLDRNQTGAHIGSRLLLAAVVRAGGGNGGTGNGGSGGEGLLPALWCFGHVHEGRGGKHINLRAANALEKGAAKAVAAAQGSAGHATLCVNAANANDGRAASWPQNRPPILVRLHLSAVRPPAPIGFTVAVPG